MSSHFCYIGEKDMSALGNYVHYHKKNYRQWGINQVGTSVGGAWTDVVRQAKAEVKSSLDIQKAINDAKYVEELYNNLFYPKKVSSDSIKFKTALEKAIQSKLEEQFGLQAGKFNAETLSTDSTSLQERMQTAISKAKKTIADVKLERDVTVKTLLSKIDSLYQVLNYEGFQSVPEARAGIEKAKQELDSIAKKFQNQLINSGDKNPLVNLESKDVQTVRDIISTYNRIIPLHNQNGDLFEWLLPFLSINVSALGSKALAEEMMKIASDPSVILGDANLSIDIPDLLNAELKDIDITTDNVQIKTTSSRSKTDVVITYTDEAGKQQTSNVSAKNVKKLHAKIVNNISLLRILLFSQTKDFGTHYLNIVSAAGKEKSAESKIIQANRIIKSLLIKLGAEGYVEGNKADLLIVNEQAKKKIHVYSMKVLIYYIQNGILNNDGKYANIIKELKDNETFSQEFSEESKEKRISNLIRNVSDKRFTVTLENSILQQYPDL